MTVDTCLPVEGISLDALMTLSSGYGKTSMGKVRVEDGVAIVTVKTGGGENMCGVPIPPTVECRVHHHEGYGVLVVGTGDVLVARRALKKVGYGDDVRFGPHRPARVNQEPGKWPFGLWVGGESAVAFYFSAGG